MLHTLEQNFFRSCIINMILRELSHYYVSMGGGGGGSAHADKMLTEGGRGVGPC